jgi:hypothetical protein
LNAWHETHRPNSIFLAENNPPQRSMTTKRGKNKPEFPISQNGIEPVEPPMQEGGPADWVPVAALQHIEKSGIRP